MDKRITIALAVIAAAMAAFIAFYESGLLSTGELEGRRGRVLERFVRPRVTDVTLVRAQEGEEATITLHREREEDLEAFELGHWTMTAPIVGDADQEAVDGFLSALEWLEARRTLSDVSAEDRRTFGLAEPRATIRFTVAGEEVSLRVGGEEPRGEGVYVETSDREGQAFVVGSDFLEAIQHEVAHFRRKELFSGVRSADASAIELTNATTEARLERAEGRWWVRAPWEGIARGSAIDDLFTVITGIRATRFLDGADLAAVGLDHPTRELLIRRERGEGDAADREERSSPVRLRIGGPCPDHEGEVVAIAGDDGPIACVSAEALPPLDVGIERIRESRLASLRDDELDRAELEAGESRFELVRGDEGWTLRRGSVSSGADEEALGAFTRQLRATEALAFEPATAEALRARGLDAPRATLTLHRADSERAPDVIRLGAVDGDGVWVRRGDEAQIVRYPVAAAELIAAPSIRFRDRALVHDAEGSAQRLRIVRTPEDGPPSEEIVQRDGSGWEVAAPIEVDADRIATRDVVRALASLTAVRFAAADAAPEHGLDRPRVEVTATFRGALPAEDDEEEGDEHDHDHGEEEPAADGPEREVVLRIGAATDDGSFARLGDDPAVFVIAPGLVQDLIGPLASRDLLATEPGDLETLAIVRGAERIELRREGDGWTAGTGPADVARTQLIMDRLGSLRAVGTTSYSPAAAAFASPTLVIEVTRRAGEGSHQIVVGAVGEPGEAGWYHARRSDLAVGYRLGATVVRSYLEYQP